MSPVTILLVALASLAVGCVAGIEGSRRKWPTFVTLLVGASMGGAVGLLIVALGKAVA